MKAFALLCEQWIYITFIIMQRLISITSYAFVKSLYLKKSF